MMKGNGNIVWKKLAFLLAVMCMLCALASCSMSENQADTKDQKKTKVSKISLEDRGLEVIRLMDEKLHNEEYQELMLGKSSSVYDAESYQKLEEATYGQPDKIFRITFSDDSFEGLLETYGAEDVKLSSWSKELQELAKTQIRGSFMTILVARDSASKLALQSLFTTGKIFVTDEERDRQGIYLYTYQDQYPIAVTITITEDGAASANGTFVLLDDFKAGSEEEVKESLLSVLGSNAEEYGKVLGIQIEQVK